MVSVGHDGHVVLQDQAVILKEGDPLTSVSKFYLVEAGTIECWKIVNVSFMPLLAWFFCMPA